MPIITMKMTDLGEGVSEAELIEWNVAVGDAVREDDILATVMTDKAAVEIPAVTDGTATWLAGEPGDFIPVGSDLIRLDVGGPAGASENKDADEVVSPLEEGGAASTVELVQVPEELNATSPEPTKEPPVEREIDHSATQNKPLASPSVRGQATELGLDLSTVAGSGPGGRVLQRDLKPAQPAPETEAPPIGREIKLIGLRRRIAEKMAASKSRIPHYTIVEEVDVTELEELRAALNVKHADERGKLTFLPFIVSAIVLAARDHPGVNGHFDDEAGMLRLSEAIHVGVATQTQAGLMVPVIRNAQAMGLWEAASEIARLSDLAREGRASRDDLTGSTITVTSLGPLGGLAATPIINRPEVAIVGVNRIAVRPMWDGREFRPRRMMNLSCSFDHRVVDGWDGAVFVQSLKELLETPALLFVGEG